jgi:hypothetical protein
MKRPLFFAALLVGNFPGEISAPKKRKVCHVIRPTLRAGTAEKAFTSKFLLLGVSKHARSRWNVSASTASREWKDLPEARMLFCLAGAPLRSRVAIKIVAISP